MRPVWNVSALLVLGLSTAAHAATFEYRLQQYPASAGDCHALARTLGARLTELSGVPLTRAACTDISQAGYELRFTYTADEELPLVSTLDPIAGTSAQGGIYATAAACAAALAGEQTRFETATGLTPFVAYCQRDRFSPERPFAVHIDAFGTPAMRPFVAAMDTFGDPVGVTDAGLEAQINARLREREINFSYARYRPLAGSGYGTLAILYYAPERLRLIRGEPVRLTTQAECMETLAALRPTFDAQAQPPLAMYCAYRDGYRVFDIATISFGGGALEAVDSAERFATRAACESMRAQVVATYHDQEGLQIAGSACSYDRQIQQWRVAMLTAATPSP